MFMVALGILHVVEGCLWVRRSALVLVRGLRSFSVKRPGGPLGTPSEVVFGLSPLPPLQEGFVVEPWPVALATDGVVLAPSQTLVDPSSGVERGPDWTWEEAGRVRRAGRTIEGPHRRSVKTSSAALAAHLVKAMHHVASLPPSARAADLDRLVAQSYDLEAIRSRLDELKRRSHRLRWYGNLLLPALGAGAYGILFVPAVFAVAGAMAAGLAALLILTWTETLVAHRKLYPDLADDRWLTLVLLIASPPAAIRAHAWLARDAFAHFNPVAVAQVLTPRAAWSALAGQAWRDLRWPVGAADAEPTAALAESRARHRAELGQLVQAATFAIEDFERPPAEVPSGFEAYCPRCLEMFRSSDGDCSECPGVARRPVARNPPSASAPTSSAA